MEVRPTFPDAGKEATKMKSATIKTSYCLLIVQRSKGTEKNAKEKKRRTQDVSAPSVGSQSASFRLNKEKEKGETPSSSIS